MTAQSISTQSDIDPQETQEWLEALQNVLENDGAERASFLLNTLKQKAGVSLMAAGDYGVINTPYINTIPADQQSEYPGDIKLEQEFEALLRWNAAVMVAKINVKDGSIGGHIGSFASICTLYEVGLNHFFKAPNKDHAGDLVFFQGHSSPGNYARSFLEGVFSEKQLDYFRREVQGDGLSSYPHPWLMPKYWQFPTVSMGLAPIVAIYEARLMKYLEHRKLAKTSDRHVWCFCGDGEMDEPESMGVIRKAGREKLDNLIFVVNCNLQRLDGLVNSNGKIIQELEASFRGAHWHVIKVVWGENWEQLFAKDADGVLMQAIDKACDGTFQTCQARGGAYMREHFFGQNEQLKALVKDLSDEDLQNLTRGGHDPKKVYAAYKAAVDHKDSPVVILAQTVKGYGLGKAGESRNIAHNLKKMKADDLKYLRDKFHLPVSDKQVENYEFYKPAKDSSVMQYIQERRKALGGLLPSRLAPKCALPIPGYKDFAERILKGTGPEREMSTTTAFVQMLVNLMRDKNFGKQVVPIVPDESRTFGMEGLFRQFGIYNPLGQCYEPEDRDQVMYYREAPDGQVMEIGLNEAGAFSIWLAAATSYSVHQLPMIPFYIYYSMFGFQRIGDLAWLAGDMRARGFLLGGTSGRTTINGEGLQHEDGHSHIQANLIPNCFSYDPTYGYEVAVIIWHGLKRMYGEDHDEFYYLTLMNENYEHPPMPKDCEEGIIKGLYQLKAAKGKAKKGHHVQLLGSGTILREVEAAAELLQKDFDIAADVWSMTSANQLYRDGLAISRENRLNPGKKSQHTYVQQQLGKTEGPIIAATDYVRLYTEQLRDYMPEQRRYVTLGTDGFGRSDTREALRDFFEVNRYYIAIAALKALADDGVIKHDVVKQAIKKYKIKADKPAPWTC